MRINSTPLKYLDFSDIKKDHDFVALVGTLVAVRILHFQNKMGADTLYSFD